jgi:ABC-type dipeptide/oligopeptide/nickel transport system permease component
MWRYIRRRLLLAVLTFWAVSTIVWGLLYLTGDPVAILLAGTPAGQTDVEQLRHALGFDQPLPIQYFHFLSGAVQGDLGNSLRSGEPALLLVARRVGFTVQLALLADDAGARRRHSRRHRLGHVPRLTHDRTLMLLSMVGQSMPIFWVGCS